MEKYRLLGVLVQPILVKDDGENLEKVDVQPFEIKVSQIESLGELLNDELTRLNKQL